MSMACPVCLAADNADPTNLRALVRYQAVQLDRVRSELLGVQLEVADGPRTRVQELEAQLERANAVIGDLNGKQHHQRKQAT